MKVQLNLVPFAVAIVSGLITINILNGNALNYIHFPDVLNEIGCAVLSLMICCGALFASFEKINRK